MTPGARTSGLHHVPAYERSEFLEGVLYRAPVRSAPHPAPSPHGLCCPRGQCAGCVFALPAKGGWEVVRAGNTQAEVGHRSVARSEYTSVCGARSLPSSRPAIAPHVPGYLEHSRPVGRHLLRDPGTTNLVAAGAGAGARPIGAASAGGSARGSRARSAASRPRSRAEPRSSSSRRRRWELAEPLRRPSENVDQPRRRHELVHALAHDAVERVRAISI